MSNVSAPARIRLTVEAVDEEAAREVALERVGDIPGAERYRWSATDPERDDIVADSGRWSVLLIGFARSEGDESR